MSKTSGEFLHLKGDSSFQERSSAIFSCLDNLEPQNADNENNAQSEDDTVGPLRCRKPDHVVHPEKWKKYSLEDVKETVDGLSGDQLNRHAAISFLEDLRKRKAEGENRSFENIGKEDDKILDTEMEEKIVFSKDVIKHKMEIEEILDDKTPRKIAKKDVPLASQHARGAVVGLSHLEEAEKESNVDNSGTKSIDTVKEKVEVPMFSKRKSKSSHNFRKRGDDDESDDLK